MTRLLLNLLTAVSLLPCVAAAALWVRSYWTYDEWVTKGSGRVVIDSARGGLYLNYLGAGPMPRFSIAGLTHEAIDPDSNVGRALPPLYAEHAVEGVWGPAAGTPAYAGALIVPHAALCAPAAVLPAIFLLARARRRHRRRQSRCPACAYDLTGNVSGVCPECGAAQ